MNNKNINCHPELVEGSQQNYISAHDVAENAKLNHEIAEELKRYTPASLENKGSKFSSKLALNRKRMGLNKTVCLLTLFTLLPPLAHAETCTPTPDCKSLGYNQSSCPDGGGVKCPWDTSLMYCPQCTVKDACLNCKAGMILNSDMTCSQNKISGKTPIGVVAYQTITSVGAARRCATKVVALDDIGSLQTWGNSNTLDEFKSQCNNYSAEGIKGWYLPSESEFYKIHDNISSIQAGLTKAGGTQFRSAYYWASHPLNYNILVNPVNGSKTGGTNATTYARPALDLSNLR